MKTYCGAYAMIPLRSLRNLRSRYVFAPCLASWEHMRSQGAAAHSRKWNKAEAHFVLYITF